MFEGCGLVDGNYLTWGNCFQGAMFGGDALLFTIFLIGMLAWLAYKFGIPHEAAMVMGFGLVFAMAMAFSSPAMNALAILAVIVLGGYMIIAFIKHAK